MLKDEGRASEFDADQEFLCQDIHKLLLKLTPQQREVLTLRFGLVDENLVPILVETLCVTSLRG